MKVDKLTNSRDNNANLWKTDRQDIDKMLYIDICRQRKRELPICIAGKYTYREKCNHEKVRNQKILRNRSKRSRKIRYI